ncbi:TPA: hypothetical protein EYQ19_00925 [Candidatus Pacearchaeota archaeon]|jgi:ribosomal RNA assembly protein|nr:hypothetical protein [Candidatus Pacearchaeota archaeon]
MEIIHFEKIKELRRERKFLEEKLKIKIKINGRDVSFNGEAINEFETSMILEAINLGFSARKAIQIMDEEILFRKINIKDFTKRKNLEIIRARLIGTRGRTKKTIESISGCNIIINENEVGLICHSEKMEYAITAISNIIKGSKVTNTYKYLEKTNKKGKIKKR